MAKFLLHEREKDHYLFILGGKTLVVSFGGECQRYIPDEFKHNIVTKPLEYQGDHEEADTLIAFHVFNIKEREIIIRASDKEVLIIFIGFLGRK